MNESTAWKLDLNKEEPTFVDNIRCSKPCDICKGTIMLGDNIVIFRDRLVHVKCYDNEANADEIKFLKKLSKEVGMYGAIEMISKRLKELLRNESNIFKRL
jgi:hypothetical protein